MRHSSGRHSTPRRFPRLASKRTLIAATSLAVVSVPLATGAAWAGSHATRSSATVTALSLSSAAVASGSPVTASASVSSSAPINAQLVTIAVRSATGANLDFPGARPMTLTSSSNFTTNSRSFPAGTYTYFFSYETNGVWHPLSPVKSFTVGSATPTPAPAPSAPSTSAPAPAPSTSAPQPTTTAPAPTSTAPTSSAPTSAGSTPQPLGGPSGTTWKSVFDDEFDGTTLNSSNWSTGPGWTGSGISIPANNLEKDCWDPAQVSVSGGTLNLGLVAHQETCGGVTKPYAAGGISTDNKHMFTYGYFEARMYLPPASDGSIANWPAFWTVGPSNTGEVDTVEGLGGQACFHFHSSVATDNPGSCVSGTMSGWLFTMIVVGAPAYWLFHPPFVTRVIIPFMRAIGAL